MPEALVQLLTVAAGGVMGWVGASLRDRRARRASSGDDAAAAVQRAVREAGRLRSTYQAVASASRWRKRSDAEMVGRENAFTSACDESGDEQLAAAARAYIAVARGFASRDPDVSTQDEARAYDELGALARRLYREARAR